MENGFSKWVKVAAIISMAGSLTASVSIASVKRAKGGVENEAVPGELIVKLRDSGSKAAKSAILSTLQKSVGAVEEMHDFATDNQLQLVRLSNKSASIQKAIDVLSSDPAVEYAEPNYVVRMLDSGLPDDANFSRLWGLKNTGQADSQNQVGKAGSDINVTPLWERGLTGDKKIVVAVIDTGIDYNHPDLAANIFTNTKEIPNNGKDDDGNGFVDDVYGMNFSTNPGRANGLDDHDHGSHCAGTIGGVGNNGTGVAGVNWNVSLLPVKFLSASGSGSTEGAINAINYARMMKVNVMSNSWGGGGFSQALKDAIQKTADDGIVFVAAAGNDGSNNDARATYPASYEVANIIAVAATDNQDKIAGFSNFGVQKVHVAAPGVNIFSTTKGGQYKTFSGTSMATPHVAGVAALLLAADPTLNALSLKDRLIKTSDPVPGLRRKVMSKGRVNAYNAFMNIVPPSTEPDESLWKDAEGSAESAHPYADNMNQTWTITSPGAQFIRVFFERVDTEAGYDTVTVESATREVAESLSGKSANYMSDYLKGDTAIIRLKSDGSQTSWGFKVSKVQVIR